jgi:hypothetical protein
MNLDNVVYFLYPVVMFWPFALMIGFVALVAYAINVTWLAHIRRLLEGHGFRVRHMQRDWFKRRFPGSKPPSRSEWLVRVVVEDSEGRVRSGWVRWHRLRL